MPDRARAETVGSLLCPAYLLDARDARRAGTLSDDELRKVEDRAVQEAIELQQSVGLDVITDGEHRRLSWISTVNIVEDSSRASAALTAPCTCAAATVQAGSGQPAAATKPIARDAFGRLTNFDTLLLEYDTDRAGDFTPLRQVRSDTTVVLGLLTTKHPELESAEALHERIRAAAEFVPLDRLALSPEGFAP